jgi:lycopene elongase/hydratase (dihydrobisanhydrobacterioruberin-forming)
MSITKLLRISRPRFWIYLLGPYLIGSILAFEPTQLILQWQFWLGFIYFTFPANLLIYGVNDIFDYETDKLNPKKIEYETLVTPKERIRLWLFILATNIPFILALYLINPLTSIGILGFLFLGIQYSALPIRAKSRPFLDSLFNILYIFPGIIGYSLFELYLNLDYRLLISAGLWTMAMHTYSAIPDIKADKASNTLTIATVLGSKLTLMYCFICYTLSGILLAQFSLPLGIGIAIVYGFMIGLSYNQNSARIFRLYTYFPLLNALIGFILFWSIILYIK